MRPTMRFPLLRSALGAVLMLALPGAAQALGGRLEADRGEFRLRLDDGRVLDQGDLVGASIVMRHDGQEIQVLIDAVEEDRTAPGGPVVLYRFLVEDPADRTFRNACLPDIRGRQLGLPIRREMGIDFTCTSGAEGKCILMGYRPWADGDGVPMRDLHAACVHMMRADYGGDDRPTTRDGTPISIYDRFGIQERDTRDSMPFEAAWSRDGAICVAHPRIAQNVTLEELARRYPWLRDRLGPEACTEEAMRDRPGVLLFNRSALTAP